MLASGGAATDGAWVCSTIESLDHLSNQFRIRYAPQEDTQALVYFQRMAYIERKFYEVWKNMSLNEETPMAER